jgi:putative SOS response-associated peptidase YedK
MCGRYTGFTAEEENEIMKIINEIDSHLAVKYSGEIFPTEIVPTLLGTGDILTAQAMKWGFPGYRDRNRPAAKPRPLINAKSETARNLSTWKDSVLHRRCLIPSNGFYEWQHGGANDKTKYLFRLPAADTLYMAAIFKPFPLSDGSELPHFSILTTAANSSMREVHNRMPVIIQRSEFEQWLWGDWEKLLGRNEIELNKIAS